MNINLTWLILATFVLIFFLPRAIRACMLLYEYGIATKDMLARLRKFAQVRVTLQNSQQHRSKTPAWSYHGIFDVTGIANWINWALIFSHGNILIALLQLAIAYLEPIIWIWKTPAMAWAGALPTARKAATIVWTGLWILFIASALINTILISRT